MVFMTAPEPRLLLSHLMSEGMQVPGLREKKDWSWCGGPVELLP